MTVYIDKSYRCHPEYAEGRRAVETNFFDDRCPRYIRGYRLIPQGESWCSSDGRQFSGPMIAPAESLKILDACQQLYETLAPELSELRAKLQRMQDCVDGLSVIPSMEQLKDCLLAIREVLEDD